MHKILHADCDCFFAALEMRDNPSLKDKPIAVGGAADKRGVIATCNYPARAFGVRSAMPTAQALKLCPDLILCPPRMSVYKDAAQAIREIFFQLTDRVEVVSIDEAYLDVTHIDAFQGSATRMAQWLKQEALAQTGVTLSIGVSVNKFLAKIASDWQKPDGLFVIRPEEIESFMPNLPVGRIPGVGKVTEQKLVNQGYETCGQLQQLSLQKLVERYGKLGVMLYQRCRGEDYREVVTERVRKSVSVEHTFADNKTVLTDIEQELEHQITKLKQRFLPYQDRGVKSVFLKLRFADFTTTTVETGLTRAQNRQLHRRLDVSYFLPLLHEAIRRGQCNIRLLGVGLRFTEQEQMGEQLSLF